MFHAIALDETVSSGLKIPREPPICECAMVIGLLHSMLLRVRRMLGTKMRRDVLQQLSLQRS